MLKNLSIIFILTTFYLLLTTNTNAQTAWNILRDISDSGKLKFYFSDPATSPLTVTTDNKIGINTNNPAGTFNIQDSSARHIILANSTSGNNSFFNAMANAHLSSNAYWNPGVWNRFNTAAGASLVQGAQGTIGFYVAPAGANPISWTEKVRINSNGLGIGTATPAQPLHVYGTNPLIQIENTSNGFQGLKFNANAWQVGFGTNPAAGLWYDFSNDMGNTHQLYFNGTNWIFPTGRIGLGTASPNTKLSVMETVNGLTTGLQFSAYHTPAVVAGGIINAYDANGTTARVLALQSNAGPVGIGTLTPGYTLHVNGNAYFSAGYSGSDIRMKKNIEKLTNVLPKLNNIFGVKFDWKVDEFPNQNLSKNRQIGLIAQELEKQFPELINTDKEGYKSVDYAKFSPVLLQAIKEQQQEIKTLKQEVDLIKKELQAIKANNKASVPAPQKKP